MKIAAMKAKVWAKTKEHLDSGSDVIEGMDELTRLSLSCIIGVSGLIGAWAGASLISALISLGGSPWHLVQSWFSAVTGH